jgi:hypothetical protein
MSCEFHGELHVLLENVHAIKEGHITEPEKGLVSFLVKCHLSTKSFMTKLAITRDNDEQLAILLFSLWKWPLKLKQEEALEYPHNVDFGG